MHFHKAKASCWIHKNTYVWLWRDYKLNWYCEAANGLIRTEPAPVTRWSDILVHLNQLLVLLQMNNEPNENLKELLSFANTEFSRFGSIGSSFDYIQYNRLGMYHAVVAEDNTELHYWAENDLLYLKAFFADGEVIGTSGQHRKKLHDEFLEKISTHEKAKLIQAMLDLLDVCHKKRFGEQ